MILGRGCLFFIFCILMLFLAIVGFKKHGVTLVDAMNNFKKLTDLELLDLTEAAAKNEKAATLVLLTHLEEVDKRRAYAADAYSSLFDYVVRGLGYAEGQAAERVSAMRLMREVPEVKTHIEAGALTLTSASLIQRHLRAERSAPEERKKTITQETKSALIQECLGQSKRSVEKILFSHASEPTRVVTQERTRQISETLTEVKVLIDEETRELLKRAKELSQTQTIAELLKQTLKSFIEQREKQLGKVVTGQDGVLLDTQEHKGQPHIGVPARPDVQPMRSNDPHSRYIPVHMKRAIFRRSSGQCEYHAPHSSVRCSSMAHLQIDHVIPLAVGGKTELKNLRHLCPAHNQKAAQIAGVHIQKNAPPFV